MIVPVIFIILGLIGVIGFMRWKKIKEDVSWSDYAIRWSEIEIDEKPLGRGTFGVVYHGRYRNTEVAVKKLHFQDEAIERGLALLSFSFPYYCRVKLTFISCDCVRISERNPNFGFAQTPKYHPLHGSLLREEPPCHGDRVHATRITPHSAAQPKNSP